MKGASINMEKVTIEKINSLIQNKEFSAKVEKAEDIKGVFTEFGVDLSDDEVDAICTEIVMKSGNVELSEDDLLSVSGGNPLVVGGIIVAGAAISYAVSYAAARRIKKIAYCKK